MVVQILTSRYQLLGIWALLWLNYIKGQTFDDYSPYHIVPYFDDDFTPVDYQSRYSPTRSRVYSRIADGPLTNLIEFGHIDLNQFNNNLRYQRGRQLLLDARRVLVRQREEKRRRLFRRRGKSGRGRKDKTKHFTTYKGFIIEGGSPLKGKFKTAFGCKRACANLPYCLAADYNTYRRKCFVHTSETSCDVMSAYSDAVHFQKAPCDVIERSTDLGTEVFSGKFVAGGLEASGVDNLQDCIKQCANSGAGLASTCFGIDFDYSSHTCYLHVNRSRVCPVPNADDLLDKANAIHMVYCS